MKTIAGILYLIAVFCSGGIDTVSASENVGTSSSNPLASQVEEFAAKVRALRERVGDVYLVVGDGGPHRTEEEIGDTPGTRNEKRFGANNWTFMDLHVGTGDKRIGIECDACYGGVWKDLADRLPNVFTVILDDMILLNSSKIDKIYRLLKRDGIFIGTLGIQTLSKDQMQALLDKFDIYVSSNNLACKPYGVIGEGRNPDKIMTRYNSIIRFLIENNRLPKELPAKQREDILKLHKAMVERDIIMNRLDALGLAQYEDFPDEETQKKIVAEIEVATADRDKLEADNYQLSVDVENLLENHIIPTYFPWSANNVINGDAKQVTIRNYQQCSGHCIFKKR